jgi:hypothetical protein
MKTVGLLLVVCLSLCFFALISCISQPSPSVKPGSSQPSSSPQPESSQPSSSPQPEPYLLHKHVPAVPMNVSARTNSNTYISTYPFTIYWSINQPANMTLTLSVDCSKAPQPILGCSGSGHLSVTEYLSNVPYSAGEGQYQDHLPKFSNVDWNASTVSLPATFTLTAVSQTGVSNSASVGIQIGTVTDAPPNYRPQ